MKDWSDLEEKYQDMRLADPKAAQSFKQRMTARFQVCWNGVKLILAAHEAHKASLLFNLNFYSRQTSCRQQRIT